MIKHNISITLSSTVLSLVDLLNQNCESYFLRCDQSDISTLDRNGTEPKRTH